MGLIPGGQETLVILVVVLLLFGATAIPKLARSLGRAQGEFKKAKREFDAEMVKGEASVASPASAAPTEEQVRKTARDLGVPESGRPLDEVKRLIAQKLA
jgi:sec-independent protein translocase protein TatA